MSLDGVLETHPFRVKGRHQPARGLRAGLSRLGSGAGPYPAADHDAGVIQLQRFDTDETIRSRDQEAQQGRVPAIPEHAAVTDGLKEGHRSPSNDVS